MVPRTSRCCHAAESSSRAGDRIPESLKQVFLASNRGIEVHKPPPRGVASRVFPRWPFRRRQQQQQQLPATTSTTELKTSPRRQCKRGFMRSSNKSIDDTSSLTAFSLFSQEESETLNEHPLMTCLVQEKWPILNDHSNEMQPRGKDSLQDLVDRLRNKHGYPTTIYKTLPIVYRKKPTSLQQASYSMHLLKLIQQQSDGGLDDFRRIVASGISPNACNGHGSSLIHAVCRSGNVAFLEILLQYGGSVQVSDGLGRTPLHELCLMFSDTNQCNKVARTGAYFEVVTRLLQLDPNLLYLADSCGKLPLSYVSPAFSAQWYHYFQSHADILWPRQGEQGESRNKLESTMRPVETPVRELTPGLASMVASGIMEPEEARFLMDENVVDLNAYGIGNEAQDGVSSYEEAEDDDDFRSLTSSSLTSITFDRLSHEYSPTDISSSEDEGEDYDGDHLDDTSEDDEDTEEEDDEQYYQEIEGMAMLLNRQALRRLVDD